MEKVHPKDRHPASDSQIPAETMILEAGVCMPNKTLLSPEQIVCPLIEKHGLPFTTAYKHPFPRVLSYQFLVPLDRHLRTVG